VIINIIQHMNNINNEHQSTIRYTQRQIFHEETHKGRKPLLLRNDRQSFKFCTSSIIEHQLNVRLLPLFYKLQLVESTNSLISLAPTRGKHQLPEYSSTNWMKAPTSSYTGSNLYNREQMFSLAPPCLPKNSLAATRWKLLLPLFKHPLEPLRTTVLPSTSLPP
jgi:hypothetical protein